MVGASRGACGFSFCFRLFCFVLLCAAAAAAAAGAGGVHGVDEAGKSI